jgi:ATP-binding cassette, subfamily B, bacterial
MVLAYHGRHVPLSELRMECGTNRDGASALDVVETAERHGLDAKALQLDIDDLRDVRMPAILHWEFNHFVVLERVQGRAATIVDPALGRRSVAPDELDRAFTGVVLELVPTKRFARRRPARRAATTRDKLLRAAALPIAVITSSALLLEVFALASPAATAFVVDFVVRPRQLRFLPVLAATFVVVIVLRAAITVARERIVRAMEARLDVDLATATVAHLLSLPTTFIARRGLGDLLDRVSTMLAARDTFARAFSCCFDALLACAYAALMIFLDVRLGLVVTAVQVSVLVTMLACFPRIRATSTERQGAGGRAQTALVQAFSDPESVKAFGAEQVLVARYVAARSHELNARVSNAKTLEAPTQVAAAAEAFAVAIVLFLGGRAVVEDRMTLGVLVSFFAIQTLLAPPLRRIVAALRELGDVGPLLRRIDDILDAEPEPCGTFVPTRLEGAIRFEEVSFDYGPGSPCLLDRVSFEIAAGERVAITGPSGAGKSTILKLILGLVQPTSGTIRIDGRDLREYDLGALRRSIGAVLSGGAFFGETIFENVALGAPDASSADVDAALASACIDDVVARLSGGLLAPLAFGAPSLSGGQRQRLLLARALAKAPAILLLDESTSALDPVLERFVHESLAALRCTMLIVAHRPAAVRFADRVLRLRDGRVEEERARDLACGGRG